jgi:uncharacterized protein (TIGR02001 family)
MGAKMKKTILALSLLAPLAFVQPALADGEAAAEEEASGPWSVTLAVTSDYRFRGQSQNARDVAVQGSVDFESESGLFVGVWASMIDFSDTGDTQSEVEIDFYAGYNFTVGEGTEGSVKATYYYYPEEPFVVPYSYWEFQATLSHDLGGVTLSGEINYSPNYFFESGVGVAVAGGIEVPLSDKFTASGHVGHQWVDDNFAFGTPDWLYWDIGIGVELGHFALDVCYVDTNLSEVECFFGTDLCEGGVVGTLSISLP